ncbi:MAG: KTSC domain-containing protein [Candidatus Hatepunaea meridiana]|nr:KTSC domain-containing protein [Candidatus Hatepunaea meridiana]
MIYVDSSNLEAIGYNEEEQILRIRFLSGGEYEYYEVPQSIFEELLDSPSKGSYFNRKIKPIYQYNRI